MTAKRARAGGKKRRAAPVRGATQPAGGGFVPPPESPWRGLSFERYLLYFGAAVALHLLHLGVLRWLPLRHEAVLTILDEGWIPHAVFLGAMVGLYFAGRHARLVAFLVGTALCLWLMRPAVAGTFGAVCLVTWLLARWSGPMAARVVLAVVAALAVPAALGFVSHGVAEALRPRPSVELGLWIIFLFRCLLYQVEYRRLDESHRSFLSYLGSFTILPLAGTALIPPIPYRAFLGRYGANDPERNLRAGVGLLALGLLYQVVWTIGGPYVLEPIGKLGVAARELGFNTALEAASRWELAAAVALLPTFKYLFLAGSIFITVGNLRLLGFDLESGFRYPYLAHNFAEAWRRYNHYYRDSLMALFYDPTLARLRRRAPVGVAMGLAVLAAFFGQALVRQVLGSLTLIPPQAWASAWTSGQHLVPMLTNGIIGLITAATVVWIVRFRRPATGWLRRVPWILAVLGMGHVVVVIANGAQKGLTSGQVLLMVRHVLGL